VADKQSFELKAGYNSFETAGDEGKLIRLEAGDTYSTDKPAEILALTTSDAVKAAEKKGK
jgi:hypothetical protein